MDVVMEIEKPAKRLGGWCWVCLLTWTLFQAAGCSAFQTSQESIQNLFSGGSQKRGRNYTNRDTFAGADRYGSAADDFDLGQPDPDRLLPGDLAPGEIATTLRARLSGEDRQQAEQRFDDAEQTYDRAVTQLETHQQSGKEGGTPEIRKLFLQAAREYQLAAAAWPDSALEQDALFMVAEARFFAQHYVDSIRVFEQLLAKYPGTPHMDLVQQRRFLIAQYWLDIARGGADWKLVNLTDEARPMNDLHGHARRILQNIRLDDPTGKLADDATFALATAFFEAGRFQEAADTYEDLRRTYPGSEHQFYAHLFELKSRLESYRGPDYDGTDLVKADKLLRAIAGQFPDQVAEHRDYLDEQAGQVRTMLAERDYRMAEYFEKRGENRAASIYYQNVVEDFGETQLAESALDKTQDLASKPPVPQQRAAWLVDLFPEPRSSKPLIGTAEPTKLR